jgi:hypothetical protein
MDFSMAAMLKGAGFSRGEMEEILTHWSHGSEEGKQQGARYFDRLWERCGQGSDDSESQGQNSETIARLAKLSIEAYEGKRKDEAKALNWRVGVLDKAVEKARVKLWTERRAAEFAERQEREEQPVLCPDLGQEDHLALVDQAIKDLGYGGDTKLPRLLPQLYLAAASLRRGQHVSS